MDIKEETVLEGIIWSGVLYRCGLWVSTKDHQVWTCALGQPDELLSSYIIPVCQDCIILLSLSWYSQDLEQHGVPQCKAVPCKWTRPMTQFGIILCFLHFSCSTCGCLPLNFLHCTHEQFFNWNLNIFCFKCERIIRLLERFKLLATTRPCKKWGKCSNLHCKQTGSTLSLNLSTKFKLCHAHTAISLSAPMIEKERRKAQRKLQKWTTKQGNNPGPVDRWLWS